MTKAELIEMLRDVPPDFKVILASDAEGNSHSPCRTFWVGQYVPETGYSGTALAEEDGAEEGYTADNAVILCPEN